MASGLVDAVCNDNAWMPYRFATKNSWCTFSVGYKPRGKPWATNSCDECDAVQCPYLVRDALHTVNQHERAALTRATECAAGGGTSQFADDVGAVERLPHKFRGTDTYK